MPVSAPAAAMPAPAAMPSAARRLTGPGSACRARSAVGWGVGWGVGWEWVLGVVRGMSFSFMVHVPFLRGEFRQGRAAPAVSP